MEKYRIQDYRMGFEEDQVRIGREVARNWVWPYAYNLADLLAIHAQPDFDPSTRHYCFLGADMVGYTFSLIPPVQSNGTLIANLDFPRMLPGHEPAAILLIEKAFDTLRKKGVAKVVGRVTSMCPGDIRLAELAGFSITNWGYKVYYSYEMDWGKLDYGDMCVEEIDPAKDLDACAQIAAQWYKRPTQWCRSHLAEWHQAGLITHAGIRQGGRLVAACLAAANDVRQSTAANYYIHANNSQQVKALLGRVVNKCIDSGQQNLIADLINEHRQYEPTYQELGFKKAAEWAQCEMDLV